MSDHTDNWPWKRLPEDMPRPPEVYRYRLSDGKDKMLPATHAEAKAQGTGG